MAVLLYLRIFLRYLLCVQHFFLLPQAFTDTHAVITDSGILHQMNRVLRMHINDQFIALDNTGFEYLCELEKIDVSKAEARIILKRKNKSEPDIEVTLYQALPKKMELFEWVLQKGTEIGISAFVPLVTARTERANIPKLERLQKILKEAAEQSHRGKIPQLNSVKNLTSAIAFAAKNSFLLHPRGEEMMHHDYFHDKKVNLFVGPEGGFTDEEIELAKKKGACIVGLGPRILRTETAPIVAASILLYG